MRAWSVRKHAKHWKESGCILDLVYHHEPFAGLEEHHRLFQLGEIARIFQIERSCLTFSPGKYLACQGCLSNLTRAQYQNDALSAE